MAWGQQRCGLLVPASPVIVPYDIVDVYLQLPEHNALRCGLPPRMFGQTILFLSCLIQPRALIYLAFPEGYITQLRKRIACPLENNVGGNPQHMQCPGKGLSGRCI